MDYKIFNVTGWNPPTQKRHNDVIRTQIDMWASLAKIWSNKCRIKDLVIMVMWIEVWELQTTRIVLNGGILSNITSFWDLSGLIAQQRLRSSAQSCLCVSATYRSLFLQHLLAHDVFQAFTFLVKATLLFQDCLHAWSLSHKYCSTRSIPFTGIRDRFDYFHRKWQNLLKSIWCYEHTRYTNKMAAKLAVQPGLLGAGTSSSLRKQKSQQVWRTVF